jgi:hypothetical protein
MLIETVSITEPAWWRFARHPAVWSVPLMALLVVATDWYNSEFFYDFFVNGDPQGDVQGAESAFTDHVFTYTSGVLYGQVLSAVVGVVLARRHRHGVALLVAAVLSAVLAAVTALVGRALVEPVVGVAVGMAFDHAAPRRVLLTELAAYPLYAACGVGLGFLVWRLPGGWRRLLLGSLAVGWIVATTTGLMQDDRFEAPAWLLGLPPVAAAASVALAALSGAEPLVFDPANPAAMEIVGDWGRGAGVALLVGALAWAVLLNVAAWLVGLIGRRRGP